jgi:DNA repair exonuclease SbcCD ATPase subunit
MKQTWECEVCGKKFYNEEDCVVHENEHVKAEQEKLERETNKKQSIANLNKLYTEYLKAIKEHEEKFGRLSFYGYTTPYFKLLENFFGE